jgi:hypothetical protein
MNRPLQDGQAICGDFHESPEATALLLDTDGNHTST